MEVPVSPVSPKLWLYRRGDSPVITPDQMDGWWQRGWFIENFLAYLGRSTRVLVQGRSLILGNAGNELWFSGLVHSGQVRRIFRLVYSFILDTCTRTALHTLIMYVFTKDNHEITVLMMSRSSLQNSQKSLNGLRWFSFSLAVWEWKGRWINKKKSEKVRRILELFAWII